MVIKYLTYFLINSNQQEMNNLPLTISQILTKNKTNMHQAINQLFIILSNVSNSAERLIVQKAILFSMENIHEWNNLLMYAQKWKDYSFMNQVIRRMKNRLNEEQNNSYGLSLADELKRLIQKYWMTRSPKKDQYVYQEYQPDLPRNTIITNNPNDRQQNLEKESKSSSSLQSEGAIKKPNIPGFLDQPPLLKNQIVHQLKPKNDPLINVTGRPTILKKQSILAENLKQKDTKMDVVQKAQKNENKAIQNAPTNDNVIKLLLNFNKSKQQQHQQKQIQKQNSSRLLLIQPPKIPTKNVDEQCPPQRFNFGSTKKSETYKSMTVTPIKYNPEQCIIKIKRRETIPAAKTQPVSQIKSICQFSFTKQKQHSPKLIENIPDTNFDSFYHCQKPLQIQPVEPVMIERPPKIEEIVDSAPLSFISSQNTPTFDLKRFSGIRYAESLNSDDLKMVESDSKPKLLWKNICQNLGLMAMKYFESIMKLDF